MRIDILLYIYVYYSVKIDGKWKKTPFCAFFLQKVLENKIFAVYLQCQKETRLRTEETTGEPRSTDDITGRFI